MADKDSKISYINEKGETAEMFFTSTARNAAVVSPQTTVTPWRPKREEFCRNVAAGMSPLEAYQAAYECKEPITASSGSDRLMRDTDVKLRIHQLKQPVIRKLAKKIEYTLTTALEECETATKIAYINGDAKTILAAVKLKAELVKLLGPQDINVNHHFGLLDDATTDVLIAMRKAVEDRKAKERLAITVEATEVKE